MKALTEDGHAGKAYSLTGPEALTNSEIARILSDELGREIRFINLPPAKLMEALLAAGVPEWNADALLDLQRLYREGKAGKVSSGSGADSRPQTNQLRSVLPGLQVRF